MMTRPICARCGNNEFVGTQTSVRGLETPITIIHCAKCGAAVGCEAIADSAQKQIREDLKAIKDIVLREPGTEDV